VLCDRVGIALAEASAEFVRATAGATPA
jgi:hypothetical protein